MPAAYTRPSATAGPWREPMRRSPLPTLALQIRVAVAVSVKSCSGIGSVTPGSPSSLLNQPRTVLQPARAMAQDSTTAPRSSMDLREIVGRIVFTGFIKWSRAAQAVRRRQ